MQNKSKWDFVISQIEGVIHRGDWTDWTGWIFWIMMILGLQQCSTECSVFLPYDEEQCTI